MGFDRCGSLTAEYAAFCAVQVECFMNAVIAAVGIMLVLSLCRVHVVVALIIGALAGGLLGGLGVEGLSLIHI